MKWVMWRNLLAQTYYLREKPSKRLFEFARAVAIYGRSSLLLTLSGHKADAP
jgi:hypothetical protein